MENYEMYLEKEYRPAQDWYKTQINSLENWIERYLPYDNKWINENYDKTIEGIYSINVNDKCIYIGEALKVANRLIVHAWHLAYESEKYFGILPTEIHDGVAKITTNILAAGISDEVIRKETEKDYIEKYKPILQKNDGTDSCINRSLRRDAILKWVMNAPQ